MEQVVHGFVSAEVAAALPSTRKPSEVFDCSPKTMQNWIYKDRKRPGLDPLPYYRLGRLVRFSLGEVLLWIERRRNESFEF